jgi:hypothetical protein
MPSRAMDLIWELSRLVSKAMKALTLAILVFVAESSLAVWFQPCTWQIAFVSQYSLTIPQRPGQGLPGNWVSFIPFA